MARSSRATSRSGRPWRWPSFGRSASRTARKDPRTTSAAPRPLLLTLRREVDEHLMAGGAAVARPARDIGPVGLHRPRAATGRQLGIEHGPQLLAERGILDGNDHLDTALEVPLHAVRRADQALLFPPVVEVVDAGVLEEAADHADDADGLGELGDAGP